ncbi:MAG: Alpha-ketoglutarate transporter [Mucilaginibacter sp.]|uniref:MFS transporter n=1 Tax=Mucilaginibacter sp. TaxID=1882438 RepID=UPI002618398C|nr:MFS transporter [Mucilaginibacter sp.]MDB5003864.1 Alpha-ketoglutarate transporter [Mucilaginibacter sp.]
MQQTQSPNKPTNHFKAVFSGSVGNLVEWYDWYIYAIFSLYFADSFFPKEDQTAQLFNTAGIFAIGFLMRPVGGWLMGAYSDRKGRKAALTLSILLMSGGSLIITIVPGYSTIGIAAPLILVLARMIQGLSVGGEYGTSTTYLSEIAPKNRRGLYSSFQYVTTIIGQLIALGILMLLQQWLLTPQQLESWGWRIPFAIGSLLALSAVYLRRNMEETKAFTSEKQTVENRGTFSELKKYKRESFIIIGFTLGLTIGYYTLTTYLQKFLVNTSGFSKSDSTLIMVIALFAFMLAQPLAGMLGDRMSRKKMMIIAVGLSLLTTVPVMLLLSTMHSFWPATMLIIIALVILSLNTSISGIIKAELFPVNVRSLGVGFPYAITVAIFGGTAEPIALGFKKWGYANGFYWYLTICIAVSFISIFFMPDTTNHSKLDE